MNKKLLCLQLSLFICFMNSNHKVEVWVQYAIDFDTYVASHHTLTAVLEDVCQRWKDQGGRGGQMRDPDLVLS